MTLGQKIQKMRTDTGLSQSQLADALMVSRSAVAKWENDNGTPDIDNLKLLAEYFCTDVDRLLDPSREVEVPKPQNFQPRPDTYCGKSCDSCAHREILDCRGCKDGPGKRFTENCDIAKCGRGRNVYACERCGDYYYCSTIRRMDKIPLTRVEERKREEARLARINAVAPYGAKWFLVMFWLAIVLEVCGIFTSIELFSKFEILVNSAKITETVFVLGYGAVMLRLSKFESRFTAAGVLTIITGLISLLMWYLEKMVVLENWAPILILPASILGLISTYNEYTACADIVYTTSNDCYMNWLLLRKLYFGAMIGYIACIVLLIIAPVIGLIGLVVCSVIIIVMRVRRLVDLRRTMLAFRYYL